MDEQDKYTLSDMISSVGWRVFEELIACRIARAHRDMVAGDHLDMKAAQSAADAGDELPPVVSRDAKVTARHELGHSAGNLQ